MEHSDYSTIGEYPRSVSAQSVLRRMMDSVGFRLYWAVEGLKDEDFAFTPAEGRWSIAETLTHIWGLINWIHSTLFDEPRTRPETPQEQVNHALTMTAQLSDRFAGMDEQELKAYRVRELPFWNLINGPIADALYHIGQVDTLRRIAGNPPREVKYFTGEAPR